VNFGLFRNATFTGATVSNFLLNAVAGMLLVSMMLVQIGGGLSAQEAGMLTLGYAIAIVAFIRVGEKLLKKFAARGPMIWGSLIVGLSVLLLMPTNDNASGRRSNAFGFRPFTSSRAGAHGEHVWVSVTLRSVRSWTVTGRRPSRLGRPPLRTILLHRLPPV
jgi:hypothetical protein